MTGVRTDAKADDMAERSSCATRLLHRVGAALLLTALLASCDRAPRAPSRTWEGHLSLFVPQSEPGVRAESFQGFTVTGDATLYRLKLTPDTERVGGPAPGQRRALSPLYRVTGRLLDGNVIDVDRLEYVGAPPRPEVDYQLADAVTRGDLPAVRAALGARANANTLDLLDQSPILLQTCDIEIALALLAAGAAPTARSEHGYTSLSRIVGCGGADVVENVRRLLDAGVDANPPQAMSSPLNDALSAEPCTNQETRHTLCRALLRLLVARGATFNRYELENRKGPLEWELRSIVDEPAT